MNRTTNFFRKQRKGDSTASTAVQSPVGSLNEDPNKAVNEYENGNEKQLSGKKIPSLTIRTFIMTILVSMGGFIFGSCSLPAMTRGD